MDIDTFQRMVDELKALHEKLDKLRTFIDDNEKFEKITNLSNVKKFIEETAKV